ncbi:hypothetical protein SK128_019499, partial [Halocaridina rubra]
CPEVVKALGFRSDPHYISPYRVSRAYAVPEQMRFSFQRWSLHGVAGVSWIELSYRIEA